MLRGIFALKEVKMIYLYNFIGYMYLSKESRKCVIPVVCVKLGEGI